MPELPDGPVWLATVDLVGDAVHDDVVIPEANGSGEPYEAVRLLVRVHGHPVGEVVVPCRDGRAVADDVQREVRRRLGAPLDAHLAADGLATADVDLRAGTPGCTWSARLDALGAGTPLVSVVLATFRRPERLARTLRTLTVQTWPQLEILVVDNSPSTPGARAAVDSVGDPRVRLLEEPVRGASRARNTGLRAARGEYVAFTDDDVDADPDWVANLVVELLADDGTACVTGLILPASLDTEEQRTFEKFGGFSKGFAPRVFALTDTDHGPLFPYTAGMFGSGACSAFRRDVLLELGGFPVDLGPATAARGGEDLSAYLSVLFAGYRLRYQPAALVRHEYAPDSAALARQVFGYGLGISAMITRRALASRSELRAVLRAVPTGVSYVLSGDSPKNAGKRTGYPRALMVREVAGIVCGPAAYLVSRRRVRALGAARTGSADGREQRTRAATS